MTGDRGWWKEGRQYRELAASLRDIARKCRLADPELELIDAENGRSAIREVDVSSASARR